MNRSTSRNLKLFALVTGILTAILFYIFSSTSLPIEVSEGLPQAKPGQVFVKSTPSNYTLETLKNDSK